MKNKIPKVVISLLIMTIVIISYRLWTIHPLEIHPMMGMKRPLNIAHRGGKLLWPENTIYAFERAVELGVDVIELDVHPTADGQIVVIHDATVDRTSNGGGCVDRMILAQLKELDFAFKFIPPGAAEPTMRGQGVSIPTLAEVFDKFPDLHYNIEIKPDSIEFAMKVVELIRDHGMADQVLLGSFHKKVMQALKTRASDIALIAANSEIRTLIILNKIGLGRLHQPEADAYEVPLHRKNIEIVVPKFVHAAHQLNQKIIVWTINDSIEMHRLLQMGVDGIVTDRPDILARILEEQDK